MRRFYQSVDLRSRSQMTDFLTMHFRYPTMNSWNNAVSYRNLTKEVLDIAAREKARFRDDGSR